MTDDSHYSIEVRDPWAQSSGELGGEYAAFTEFCKLGPERRSVRKLAAHLGISADRVRSMSKKNDWIARADAFDRANNALTPAELSLEDTLAFQYAVGKAMLDLGISAMQLKNPASIKMNDVIRLLKEGSEIQRKAAGINDTVTLTVESNAVQKINSLLDELGVYEVEAVEDDE